MNQCSAVCCISRKKSQSSAPVALRQRLRRATSFVYGAVAYIACSFSCHAGWTTTDDFQQSPGLGAQALASGCDPSGDFFVAGSGRIDAAGTSMGIIRTSTDGGATWSSLAPPFNLTGAVGTRYTCFTADPAPGHGGVLYVGGTGTVPGINGNVSLWFVQRSTDGGQTWSVDDTYQKTAGLDSVVNGLAVDNAGNVFACGVAMQSAGPIWTVRKRDLNGNWMIVQAIIGSKSSSTLASSIAIDPNAGIFVIGNTGSGGQGYGTWSTYRSADAGATWNLVDSFNGATAHALATYPGATASTICAVGYGPAGKSAGGTCWYVRMSNDNGAHWNTVDNFQYAHGTANNDATGVAFDSFGNVFTSGCGQDTAGVLRWVIRTRLAGTSQWQISDEYQYPNSTYNAWTPRLTSASGTVIAAGIADDSSDTEHWITRTLQ